jgi:LuxR family maltose regulon positive regulatory protein
MRIPAVTEPHVDRSRLLEQLEAGVRTGLALVCGPAGSGKTQLAAEWSWQRHEVGADIAWMTLDEDDRVAARFVRHLCAAVSHGRPGDLAVDEPVDATAFVRATSGLVRDVVLVLDEFHHVIGSDSERVMSRLARRPLPHVRFVILTRVTPHLGAPRLRLAGRLREIRSSDLAMTTREVGVLLQESGVELTDHDVETVQRRTSGWVAAVRLVVASLGDQSDRSDLAAYLAGLPGSDPEVTDYLHAEVYDEQPVAVQGFMDRVGLLDEVCGDLADALTGRDDGDAMLSALAEAQLMTRVAGRPSRWFRWHPLVGAFLRQALHDRSSRLEQQLHRLASDWYEGAGHPGQAGVHALGGWGDEVAAGKLSVTWLELLLSGQSALLSRLLDVIDEDVIAADPRLAVARAFMVARRDDLETALALARTAVRGTAILPPDEGLSVRIVATAVELYVARMTGVTAGDGMTDSANRLLVEAGRDGFLVGREHRVERALLSYQLGAFLTSRAGYDAAGPHVAAALRETELLDVPYLGLSCHAQLAELSCQAGRLHQAWEHARPVLDAEEQGWHSRLGLTNTHLALAQLAILRDDLDAALAHLTTARALVRRVDLVNRLRLRFLTATAVCASGEVAQATRQLKRFADEARGVAGPAWVPDLVVASAARHDACQGRPEEGLKRLGSDVVGRGLSVVRPYDVLRADLLLRCGRPREALEVVDLSSVEGDGVVAWVGAQVTKALAHQQLGDRPRAVEAVADAVREAAGERLVQPFVAPGGQAKPLLEELLERGTTHEAMVLEVLSHMEAHPRGTHRTSSRSPYFVDALSDRELEVLERLPSTMTNEQLAQAMFISVNTLRTHMKSINRKLGATGRRDAVRRARQLGLL